MKELTKKNRIVGLFLFCNKCKRSFRYHKLTCRCGDEYLRYKYKVHIPFSGDKVITRNLQASNIESAIEECKIIKQQLKEQNFSREEAVKIQRPVLLLDCIEAFMAHIRDDDVAYHEKENRTEAVIKRYELSLVYLCAALENSGTNTKSLNFLHFNKAMVGEYQKYLLEVKTFAAKTYNNQIASVKKFHRYIAKTFGYNCPDIFGSLRKQKVEKDQRAIKLHEFYQVLDKTTHENGYYLESGTGKKRNRFRAWLKTAFILGLFTGGRREEVVSMKWNGIKHTFDGDMSHIEVIHFKSTKRNKNQLNKGKPILKEIPMNEDLKEYLMSLGYEEHRGKDEYILAPGEAASRFHMMQNITEAFSLYYKLLNTGVVKNFKHLRKTYITALYIKRANETHKDTGHEGMGILFSNYINDEMILEERRKKFREIGKIFNNPLE